MEVRNPGFFTMDHVTRICACCDLQEAKSIALQAITDKTTASPQNAAKATAMIEKALTVKQLGLSVSNFILAHDTPELKVISSPKPNASRKRKSDK